VLAYPSASLAYLLEAHVGYSADKRYQLADWRLRPLPDDMMAYARADTR
jgi:exosome complex exonuclease RRP6